MDGVKLLCLGFEVMWKVKSENYWFQVCGIPGIGGNHHVNFLFIEGISCEFPILEGIVFAELPDSVVVVSA